MKLIKAKPINPFTAGALKRWNKIPAEFQEKVLSNVWCGKCKSAIRIVLESAEMIGKSLVLRGKCEVCNGKVCRVVEPEEE